MAVSKQTAAAGLEVTHPSGERTRIRLEPLPFRIGRGPENHLIVRDNRASRAHAKISHAAGGFLIEDLDSLHGTWVNGIRIASPTPLHEGDTVEFGFEDSYRLIFSERDARIPRMLDQISASGQATGAAGSLSRLRALVELARSLETTLAWDEVLGAIVDAALALTDSERGFLLLRSGDTLEVKLGRDARGAQLPASELDLPASLIARALEERHYLLSMNLPAREQQPAHAICVPLVHFPRISVQETLALPSQTATIGLLYLESARTRPGLSELNRELLQTLALEASTILDNARLLEEEKQNRRREQELALARQIQESLLPRALPASGWFCAAGSSTPSTGIAGDYFDVQPLGPHAWAAVIADVSGKGVASALLASLLQGAFLLGSELEVPLDALLSKINSFLAERAQGEKYATLFCAVIHRSGTLTWANAGHAEPLLLSATGFIRRLRSTGMPLGLRAGATFEVERAQLVDGDKLIAFSDGLIEAENEHAETFESRLPAALAASNGLSAQATHDRLLDELLQFRGAASLHDDTTLLVIEYRAA
ncbi:MAG TPA: SpoIIE family protein phosphatase [Bryobacteraceae bacterium]|nr:SpoIIE family protein phosphatase [Bryobacteraceae bacterium]